MADTIILEVARFLPERGDTELTYESFEVPLRSDWMILDRVTGTSYLDRTAQPGKNDYRVQAYDGDGAVVYQHACTLGCEGIVSKRRGSSYRMGRTDAWVKIKNPAAPAVQREREIDWAKR